MSALDLISVHVPKCGGTSLLHALTKCYPDDQIVHDYEDHPTNPSARMNMDPVGWLLRTRREIPRLLDGKRVIHGHFHIEKYRTVNANARITVLREPVARMLSHYFHWARAEPTYNDLHRYVREERLSVREFAHLPIIRYFYTGLYFRGVDMRIFDFVGDVGSTPALFDWLGATLNRPMSAFHSNRNDDAAYAHAMGDFLCDSKSYLDLRGILAEDVAFYERWSTSAA